MTQIKEKETLSKLNKVMDVFKTSLFLGCTSFGGPIAHLGYFHHEYVIKKQWLDERRYADLVALCQFLPGPASSQVGIGIGLQRAGFFGGLAAWLGFTLPSAMLLLVFAFLVQDFSLTDAPWVHGLKIVAVAVVAHAVLTMGRKLASEKETATIAVLSACGVLLWQNVFTQVTIIALAGVAGYWLYRRKMSPLESHNEGVHWETIKKKSGFSAFCLGLFGVLLFVMPILSQLYPHALLTLADSFYRSGALVFGGGHVVMPLLELELVPSGLISKSDFIAGYGATQAVPGPLFTFASYLGAVVGGFKGAIVGTIAIFLPAFLLVAGVLPFWERLSRVSGVRAGLIGVNAGVVGILAAALYNPLWTSAIKEGSDVALAGILFIALEYWKTPPWLVVVLGAIIPTVVALWI